MPPTPVVALPGLSRYGALAQALRRRVLEGEWPPASAMPAEQTLAAEYGVALGTVRQALDLLATEGLIERRHGRGTFVRAGLQGASLMRFFRFGGAPGEVPHSRILAREVLPLPAAAAAALGGGRAEPALRLRRLRALQGQPVVLEEIWLPLPMFEALVEGATTDWGDLLYPLYADRCGVLVHRAEDEVRFGQLGAADARLLRLPAGHPCASVHRTAFDREGRRVEWRHSRGDAHAFRYTVSIT